VYATAERLPFADDSFDVVSVCEVLEHLQKPENALDEALRVASRAVVVTVPNEWDWTQRLSPFAHGGHVRFYDDNSFLFLLRGSGRQFDATRIHWGEWAWFGAVIYKGDGRRVPKMDQDQVRYLLWNDQGLKAKEMVEAMKRERPDDPAVLALAAEVDSWVKHSGSKEEYERFYSNYRRNFTPSDAVRNAHERIPRFGLIRRWMTENTPKTILDLGCFDGFSVLNLAEAFGASGVGVDLDEEALAYARRLAAEMRVSCRFVRSFIEDLDLGQKFDAILLTEILEHVLDPATIIHAAERHLAENGRIFVTSPATPVPHFGNEREAREHVRCPSSQDLRKAFGALVVDRSLLQRSGQHVERILSLRRMRVAFVTNDVAGGWSPLQPGGYAGGEEGVVELSKVLAENGCVVNVYHNAPAGEKSTVEFSFGGGVVRYFPRGEFDHRADWDVVILLKCPEMLDLPFRKPVIFWTSDPNGPGDFTPERLTRIFRVVAISEWHKKELLDLNPALDPKKVVVLPYGVQPRISEDHPSINRPPHKMVYASSFDRGLNVLLLAWPEIRKNVSDAELHIWYGWELFDRFTRGNQQAAQWKEAMCQMMKQDGIVIHSRLDRPDDPAPFRDAALWAYPCTGGERFCITAIKAQRLGAIPVVIPMMALENTVKYGKKVQMEEFVPALISALKDEAWQREERERMTGDPAVALPWTQVSDRWLGLMKDRLGEP
jgi:2-polyprenyl-3-methyl-5-hydroxy-6-metoxy-1,4-benzoquinol methylase